EIHSPKLGIPGHIVRDGSEFHVVLTTYSCRRSGRSDLIAGDPCERSFWNGLVPMNMFLTNESRDMLAST
ncbi:11587_t:CDS:2, partial [Scutellospora calospora]